jgi:hypothetical protein
VPILVEYINKVVQRLQPARLGSEESSNVEHDNLLHLLPKTEKTKKRFKKAWIIWKKMLKEYENDVVDRSSNIPKPKIQDFQTRVYKEMNWKVSERRLQTVIQVGEAKLIK